MRSLPNNQSTDIIIAGVGGQDTALAAKLLALAALYDGRSVRTSQSTGMALRGGSVLEHVRIGFKNSGVAQTPTTNTGTHANARSSFSQFGTARNSAEQSDTVRNSTWQNDNTRVTFPQSTLASMPPMSPTVALKGANIIIGFEPAESVRALKFVHERSVVITASKAIIPVTASLEKDANYDGSAQLKLLKQFAAYKRLAKLVIVDETALNARLELDSALDAGHESNNGLRAKRGFGYALSALLLGATLASNQISISTASMKSAIESTVNPLLVEQYMQALYVGLEL